MVGATVPITDFSATGIKVIVVRRQWTAERSGWTNQLVKASAPAKIRMPKRIAISQKNNYYQNSSIFILRFQTLGTAHFCSFFCPLIFFSFFITYFEIFFFFFFWWKFFILCIRAVILDNGNQIERKKRKGK